MTERPILFSGPMVRAILDGKKTVTRRIVKPQPATEQTRHAWMRPGVMGWTSQPVPAGEWHEVKCPYGEPGDRLWVKETIVRRRSKGQHGPHAYYVADDARVTAFDNKDRDTPHKWPWQRDVLPSIHMPRRACRIVLDVVAVSVERLQDISEEDARAEGVVPAPFCKAGRAAGLEHVDAFESLWDDINGKTAPWASNPWVWRVAFRRVA